MSQAAERAPPDAALGWFAKADILAEALPFMRRFAGRVFVIKYGGHAMGESAQVDNFAHDVVLLKRLGIRPAVVHGGGPQIGRMLERLNIKSAFVDGLRVTDGATMEIVEMVLAGSINKAVVAALNRAGGRAVGLSGKDGDLIRARRLTHKRVDPQSNVERVLDLGFVGAPESIDTTVLSLLMHADIIPVIAPTGVGPSGETLNINADTVAGAVAAALEATRFLLLTDVAGVLDRERALVPDLSTDEALAMIRGGVITGGMIPKVETCLDAVDAGVEAAVILDGRQAHALLFEIFTAGGAGTLIRRAGAAT